MAVSMHKKSDRKQSSIKFRRIEQKLINIVVNSILNGFMEITKKGHERKMYSTFQK